MFAHGTGSDCQAIIVSPVGDCSSGKNERECTRAALEAVVGEYGWCRLLFRGEEEKKRRKDQVEVVVMVGLLSLLGFAMNASSPFADLWMAVWRLR